MLKLPPGIILEKHINLDIWNREGQQENSFHRQYQITEVFISDVSDASPPDALK
jgi:hypothetical protein